MNAQQLAELFEKLENDFPGVTARANALMYNISDGWVLSTISKINGAIKKYGEDYYFESPYNVMDISPLAHELKSFGAQKAADMLIELSCIKYGLEMAYCLVNFMEDWDDLFELEGIRKNAINCFYNRDSTFTAAYMESFC